MLNSTYCLFFGSNKTSTFCKLFKKVKQSQHSIVTDVLYSHFITIISYLILFHFRVHFFSYFLATYSSIILSQYFVGLRPENKPDLFLRTAIKISGKSFRSVLMNFGPVLQISSSKSIWQICYFFQQHFCISLSRLPFH